MGKKKLNKGESCKAVSTGGSRCELLPDKGEEFCNMHQRMGMFMAPPSTLLPLDNDERWILRILSDFEKYRGDPDWALRQHRDCSWDSGYNHQKSRRIEWVRDNGKLMAYGLRARNAMIDLHRKGAIKPSKIDISSKDLSEIAWADEVSPGYGTKVWDGTYKKWAHPAYWSLTPLAKERVRGLRKGKTSLEYPPDIFHTNLIVKGSLPGKQHYVNTECAACGKQMQVPMIERPYYFRCPNIQWNRESGYEAKYCYALNKVEVWGHAVEEHSYGKVWDDLHGKSSLVSPVMGSFPKMPTSSKAERVS